MLYTVYVENFKHLSKIVAKNTDDATRCIYFCKHNDRVYMSATDGCMAALYMLREKSNTEDVSSEEKEFNIAFMYNELLDSYLKASKKSIFLIFDSVSKTLQFTFSEQAIVHEYKFDNLDDVYYKVDMNGIINKGISVITKNTFNVTSEASFINNSTFEKVFPAKKGTLIIYGDTENKYQPMIARWSENSEYCAIVMPMKFEDDIISGYIKDIKNYFNV